MSFDMNINETEIDNTLLLINSSINTSFLNKIIDNNQESFVLKYIKAVIDSQTTELIRGFI